MCFISLILFNHSQDFLKNSFSASIGWSIPPMCRVHSFTGMVFGRQASNGAGREAMWISELFNHRASSSSLFLELLLHPPPLQCQFYQRNIHPLISLHKNLLHVQSNFISIVYLYQLKLHLTCIQTVIPCFQFDLSFQYSCISSVHTLKH